jgi:hypothetical protein
MTPKGRFHIGRKRLEVGSDLDFARQDARLPCFIEDDFFAVLYEAGRLRLRFGIVPVDHD